MIDTVTRGFGSPLRYIQGPGEFENLAAYTKPYGRACILIDGFLYSGLEERLKNIYECSEYCSICFEGECCREEAERICADARNEKSTVFIGVGGGKTLDTAKICADELGLPLMIIPTSASTDAAVSEIAVLYSKDGVYQGSRKLRRNAELVLVDTEIIVKAPKRLFVAGIGDALATCFEAKTCDRTDSPNYIAAGLKRCKAGMAIAQACEEILFADAENALLALDAGVPTEAFENIVEANVLLSGLGFLNTGLAAAHGIHSGLTALPEAHGALHGEKVAFGIVCQLVLENQPQEIVDKTLRFMVKIGLPVTLRQMKIEKNEKNIKLIAEKTAGGPLVHHEDRFVSAETLYHIITAADALGEKYLSAD